MKGSSEAVLIQASDGYVSSRGTWPAWPPCVENVVCLRCRAPGLDKVRQTRHAGRPKEVPILQCPWALCRSAAHMYPQSQDMRAEPEGSSTSKVASGPSARKPISRMLACPIFPTGALVAAILSWGPFSGTNSDLL